MDHFYPIVEPVNGVIDALVFFFRSDTVNSNERAELLEPNWAVHHEIQFFHLTSSEASVT